MNCIVRRGNELVGENTDGRGFLQSLRELSDPAGRRVVILGAGGAARAIGVELALAGARSLSIVNWDGGRGVALADLLSGLAPEVQAMTWMGDYRVPRGTDIVIHATSIGLHPDIDSRVPVDFSTLNAGMIVADIVPNPPETRFLLEARRRGCSTLDGLGMLVNQGFLGFRLWTGIEPKRAVMRQALEVALGISDTSAPGWR